VQKKVVDPVISLLPPAIQFKLRFATRNELKTVSNDDTHVFSTNKTWVDVVKLLDPSIRRYCVDMNCYEQLPYNIRAPISSARANEPKETSTTTLPQEHAESSSKIMNLVRLSYSNGLKDIAVTIDSVWTYKAIIPPPEPEPIPDQELPSSQKGKSTQKSLQQYTAYQGDQGVFWIELKSYWACDRPLHCKIKARQGIACWVNKGRDYG
jgi:hypothetical protein